MFQIADIYTSSGSVVLFNSWTPYVSKFDTSSFYNWEQDNLPLYDLEDRTYEMWEQGGFPTSALTGIALTVSSNTPTATLAANPNIFVDVSSCMAAIPKIIRCPILVEVCNYGDLGNLQLHNIRIEEEGSLEIINRAYSRVYTASADVDSVQVDPLYNETTNIINEVSSVDLSSTLFSGIALDPGVCTSGVHIKTQVLSATDDVRVSSVYSFLYPQSSLRKAPLAVSVQGAGFLPGDIGENVFSVPPYEQTETTDKTLASTDISSTNTFDGTLLKRQPVVARNNVGGSVYLNNLSSISVRNCDGPIYIRNFVVDGRNEVPLTGTEVGIKVDNSEVVLENCAAIKCREAGFKFNSSKVVLSRSAFAYRNYELSTATARTADKGIGFDIFNSEVSISSLLSDGIAYTNYGGGDFQASGDDIMVCISRNHGGIRLNNSKFFGGYHRRQAGDEQTGGITTCELNTQYGIEAHNSYTDMKGLFDFYLNETGVALTNATTEYEDFCVDYNSIGFKSHNSTAILNDFSGIQQSRSKQIDFSGNGAHIKLQNNSRFTFKKQWHTPEMFGNTFMGSSVGQTAPALSFQPYASYPGIVVDNNSMADFIHLKITNRPAAWVTAHRPLYGLAMTINRNSQVHCYGSKNGATFILGPAAYTKQHYVAGVYACEGSEVSFHGPTFIGRFGVDVLAEDHATINFTPPTTDQKWKFDSSGFDLSDGTNHTSVELHSTRACLVANRQSTINLRNLGSFDHYWANSPTGLIAKDTIGTDMSQSYGSFDLSAFIGKGSLQFFPNPQNATCINEQNLATIESAAGSIGQTIPVFQNMTHNNQFLIKSTGFFHANDSWKDSMPTLTQGGVCIRATEDSTVNVQNVCFPVGTNTSPLDGIYYTASGSDCDKLMIWNIADTSRLNASYISVSGMYPSDVGYHGPSSTWTSATSIGGGTPGNPVTGTGESAASGSLSGTPDTGILSVLDAFGAGNSLWLVPSGVTINMPTDQIDGWLGAGGSLPNNPQKRFFTEMGFAVSGYGKGGDGMGQGAVNPGIWGQGIDTYNNQGVFRIYFGVKAEAKLLQADASGYFYGIGHHEFSGVQGAAYQTFAQGYNCSGPLSATLLSNGNNVSALYPNLLKLSRSTDGDSVANNLWTSGFYYCNEFVEDNPTQCMLDESAANSFANAKNASLKMAWTPRKVTLIRARENLATNIGSDSYEGVGDGELNPRGFKSSNVFDLRRDN